MSWPETVTIDGVELRLTCYACPEQYDAYIGDEQVGYLRLRHGEFYAECPECGGERVFESSSMQGDGIFEGHEREEYLTLAVQAIKEWKNKQSRMIPHETNSVDALALVQRNRMQPAECNTSA